jgi:hypothetical protein
VFDSVTKKIPGKTNKEKCGRGKMYNYSHRATLTISPGTLRVDTFGVDTSYKFEDGHRLSQAQVDSTQKHELGHKEDMKCTAKKLPTRKVMFEGCFCESELYSLRQQERDNDTTIYRNMFMKADSNYHAIYKGWDYPDPQVPYVCPE